MSAEERDETQRAALAYGERYASPELALILALSAAGQFLTFIKFPFDIGILALGKPRAMFFLYAVPALLLFTAGVALVHWLGILGVPISGLLINATLLAATIVVYLRLARRAPERYVDAGRAAAA